MKCLSDHFRASETRFPVAKPVGDFTCSVGYLQKQSNNQCEGVEVGRIYEISI